MAGASVDSSIATLRAGLAALRDGGGGGGGDASMSVADVRTALGESLQRVHLRATSAGMLWGGGSVPSDSEATSLLQQYEQDMLQFFAVCHGAACDGAGPTLRASLLQHATALTDASTELLLALAGNRKGSDLNKLTGMVWQACTAAKKMAPDNKTAMCKRLTQIASGVKDAINEVTDMLREQEAGDRGSMQGLSDSDDEDIDFSAEQLSPQELIVAKGALAASEAVIEGMKAVLKAWLTGNDFPRGKEEVEALELTLQHMAGAGTAAEGLAASLYAPQDAAEVRATMEGLSKAWKAALSGLRAIELCRDSVDIDTEARFKAAMEGLPAEVAKLQG
eukprot:jgi/Tetstr1/463600/TSEL_000753.t1